MCSLCAVAILRFRDASHLCVRVRDMCQYRIKTMSIDWKIIIVQTDGAAAAAAPAADKTIKTTQKC